MIIDMMIAELDGTSHVEQVEVPDDYFSSIEEKELVPREYVTYADLAAAIREGVNTV